MTLDLTNKPSLKKSIKNHLDSINLNFVFYNEKEVKIPLKSFYEQKTGFLTYLLYTLVILLVALALILIVAGLIYLIFRCTKMGRESKSIDLRDYLSQIDNDR